MYVIRDTGLSVLFVYMTYISLGLLIMHLPIKFQILFNEMFVYLNQGY